jgi:hypothetical protein
MTTTRHSSFLGPNSLFTFLLFPFNSSFLFHFHATAILSLPFPFLYYLPISSPFPSFPLFFVSFFALPVLLRHFSSCPSLPQFSIDRLQPRSNFNVTEVFIILISFLPQSFPLSFCPSVHIIMFLGLLALQVEIYHGTALDYDIYPLLFFSLFITNCFTDFYSSVLCSSQISTSSLPCPSPSPHYSVRCIPALHLVLLPCYTAELQLISSYCFVLDDNLLI